MGCMCKKVLKLLGGLGLIYASYLANMGKLVLFDPWMILGLMFFLMGVMPFICKCDCCGGCSNCEMPGKKKR
ncbi:MAG: hypothetical protein NTV88_01615 [Candidatus Micrarchaeota archaeon]|nr:hypothetical protein [Candidatus Micrarchaeota archaeon]